MLLGHALQRVAGHLGDSERLARGQRSIDELVVGGEEGDPDQVRSQVVKGEHGLQGGDPAAGDQHVMSICGLHCATTLPAVRRAPSVVSACVMS